MKEGIEKKKVMLMEFIKNRYVDVILLQETHNDTDSERDWELLC